MVQLIKQITKYQILITLFISQLNHKYMYTNCFPTVNNSFSQYQQCVNYAFRQNEEGGGGGSGSTSSG